MEQTTKHYLRPKGMGVKLHLGCGDYWFEGYINIDHGIFGGTDMIWDLREPLPFQSETVELIESYEFVEHFTNSEINKMLDDWYKLLINGGKVVAVVPNIDKLMELGLVQQIYGIEQDHKWGYNPDTLYELFEKHGFKDITVTAKEFINRPGEPKLELICQK